MNSESKKYLLSLARWAIRNRWEKSAKPPPPDSIGSKEELSRACGVFVTLKCLGELRGCIGYIESEIPLLDLVPKVAQQSAFTDSRFAPVQEQELPDIQIEISVMTPPQKVAGALDIQVGRDGLIIEQGRRRGLLLPQVATENGWDVEVFLRHTCKKAGLPAEAWKESDSDIYTFQCEVFSEDADHE